MRAFDAALKLYVAASPADHGFDADAGPGDVVNAQGDLLHVTKRGAIPSGTVFVTADQAAKAQAFGWVIDQTSSPERDDGLVRVSR